MKVLEQKSLLDIINTLSQEIYDNTKNSEELILADPKDLPMLLFEALKKIRDLEATIEDYKKYASKLEDLYDEVRFN